MKRLKAIFKMFTGQYIFIAVEKDGYEILTPETNTEKIREIASLFFEAAYLQNKNQTRRGEHLWEKLKT